MVTPYTQKSVRTRRTLWNDSVTAAAAGVFTAAVIAVVVMVAPGERVVDETAFQQGFHSFVRIALHAAKKADAGLSECVLRSAADAAAEKNINMEILQKNGKRAVAAASGGDDNSGQELSIVNIIDGEVFRMPEVLEYDAVFTGDCNAHGEKSLLFAAEIMIHPNRAKGNGILVNVF